MNHAMPPHKHRGTPVSGFLFDKDKEERGGVRRVDPLTSFAGAEQIGKSLKGLNKLFIERLRALGGTATANEVAQGREPLRRRASDLDQKGAIEVAGVRNCKVTGCKASVYRETK